MPRTAKTLGMVLCLMAVFMLAFGSAVLAAGDKEYTGVLEEKDGKMMLKTADGEYEVSGDVMAQDMVGKKVKVMGMEEKDSDGKKMIKATKIEPAM